MILNKMTGEKMVYENRYRFALRKDMPRGFIANEQYPELPAIHQYLTPFDGQEFKTVDEFEEIVVNKFLEHLKGVPEGNDRKLRTGLDLEKLPENRLNWEYSVFTPSSSLPGMCVFGGLEKITEDK
jgi:hypothetical protein